MRDDAIDLSPLDPSRDAAHFDAVTRSIAHDAMAARARRQMPNERTEAGIIRALVAWSVPALVAAAVILAVALPTVRGAWHGEAAVGRNVSAADAMGIPRGLSELLHSDTTPSLNELHEALVGDASR
jgi:anti-sigma factor RsiW